MLSTTVDDILLSYHDTTVCDKYFAFVTAAFDITTASGNVDELTLPSLHIYQSSSGISLDQTQHIYSNILLRRYGHSTPLKHTDNPTKAHQTYKYDLSQSPIFSPDELPTYEQKFH